MSEDMFGCLKKSAPQCGFALVENGDFEGVQAAAAEFDYKHVLLLGQDMGKVRFAVSCKSECFDQNEDLEIIADALRFIDIEAERRDDKIIVDGKSAFADTVAFCNGQTIHEGVIAVRKGEQKRSGVCILCDYNSTISPSFLIGAIKYAFERRFGKTEWIALPAALGNVGRRA